jgi:hypothetical protein
VAIEEINAASMLQASVLELARGVSTRVTLEALDRVAVITPVYAHDGRHLWVGGVPGIYRTGPSGQSPEAVADIGQAWVLHSSPDGRWLLYTSTTPETANDLWALPLAPVSRPIPYLVTRADEQFARFSPDGRWVTYVSDETGRDEVYVDAFPEKRERQQVSIRGGRWPMWSDDGRRLFFLTHDNRMMDVQVTRAGDDLRVTVPVERFRTPVPNGGIDRVQYWPSPDGQRFLFNARLEEAVPRTINVVLAWPALLGQQAPGPMP